MQPDARKYLYDIQYAAARIAEFTAGKVEIVGEALAQLARIDEEVVAQIAEYRRIISFRNILIHGYAQVDDRLVWDVVHGKLPTLQRDVERILAQP